MTLRDTVSVPWAVANHLFERFDIGPTPEILSGNEMWIPPDSRGQFEEAVENELAKQNLLVGNRLSDSFHEALTISSWPGAAYFGWVESHEYGKYALQLARTGRDAVLLLRRGEWISFASAQGDDLARAFLERLPEFWFNNEGKPITLPRSEVPASGDDPPANRTAMRLRDMLALQRYGGGQLHAMRTTGTIRQRCTTPLNYLDNADGRWMMYQVPGTADDGHVVAFPGHPGKVHDKLSDMLTQLS